LCKSKKLKRKTFALAGADSIAKAQAHAKAEIDKIVAAL